MAKLPLPYGSGREDEDDILNEMLAGEGDSPRTMPPPINQPMQTPKPPVDLGSFGAEHGIGGPSAGGPLGSTPSPQAMPPASPAGMPGRTSGGALANYGTGNIAGAENISYGDTSRLRGFNTNEWGPGGTEGYEDSSIKNTFGKIASRYDSKPSSLQSIISDPDFQKYFPEAKIVGFDKIDFGDGNPVDVLISADPNSDSADGWAWQTGGGEGGNISAPASGGQGGSGIMDLINSGEQATNPDALAAIMAQIEALSKGQNPMEEDELNKLLAGI